LGQKRGCGQQDFQRADLQGPPFGGAREETAGTKICPAWKPIVLKSGKRA